MHHAVERGTSSDVRERRNGKAKAAQPERNALHRHCPNARIARADSVPFRVTKSAACRPRGDAMHEGRSSGSRSLLAKRISSHLPEISVRREISGLQHESLMIRALVRKLFVRMLYYPKQKFSYGGASAVESAVSCLTTLPSPL